jgi:hypothetical protein
MTSQLTYDDRYWKRRAARQRVMVRRAIRDAVAASAWRGLFITLGAWLLLGGMPLA